MSTITNRVTFDFTGARALVTGGTSGIGHAIATAFVSAGASVTVTGTRAGPDEYDGIDLRGVDFVQVDNRHAAAVDELATTFDTLDVLVNNAGATFPGGVDERTPEGFAESLESNLMGAMRLTIRCHAALAASAMPGGACVINIVSMSAFRAVPMVPGYSAAKAALVALTRNLAVDWIDDGIRVNALAPGLIDTRMTAPMAAFPDLRDREIARIPAGRMGTPEECASAALFLASEASAYTTGSVFAVDGGFLAF